MDLHDGLHMITILQLIPIVWTIVWKDWPKKESFNTIDIEIPGWCYELYI